MVMLLIGRPSIQTDLDSTEPQSQAKQSDTLLALYPFVRHLVPMNPAHSLLCSPAPPLCSSTRLHPPLLSLLLSGTATMLTSISLSPRLFTLPSSLPL